jgi:hypothetical protein
MNKQFIVISALCAFVVGAPVYAEEVLPSKGSLFAKKPTLFAQYRGIQNGLGDNHEPFTLIYSRFLNEKSVKVTTDEKIVLFEELEHRGVTPLMLGKVRLFSRSVDKELKRFPWLAVGLTAAAFIAVAIAIMYQRHAQAVPPADGEVSGLATEGTQSSWLASLSGGQAISKWWSGDVATQPDDNTPPRPRAGSDASGGEDGGRRSVPLVPADQNAGSGTSADFAQPVDTRLKKVSGNTTLYGVHTEDLSYAGADAIENRNPHLLFDSALIGTQVIPYACVYAPVSRVDKRVQDALCVKNDQDNLSIVVVDGTNGMADPTRNYQECNGGGGLAALVAESAVEDDYQDSIPAKIKDLSNLKKTI